MAKKRGKTKAVAKPKKKTVQKAAKPETSAQYSETKNPIILLGKTISLGVIIVSIAFLIFGTSSEVVFAIPIAMGLILLGIVFAILLNRQAQQ